MDKRRKSILIRRAQITQQIRNFFMREGFVEIETPVLVSSPGMEPHLRALETECTQPDGRREKRYLHTSPEYAMKKLLGEGWERIFQICRVFRDGECGPIHQMEFTMLEWYRANADYRRIMEDCEQLLGFLAETVRGSRMVSYQGRRIDFSPPAERLSVWQAMKEYGGVDIATYADRSSLLEAARREGYRFSSTEDYSYEDVFFKIFLERVEPRLGSSKPTLLYDYPAALAALARLKPGNSLWAERFELYVAGLELANAFSELIDPAEQRRRFEEEQRVRAARGTPVYPVDEELLQALGNMSPSAGIALGLDRLAMILCDVRTISEVLAFAQ